MAITDWLRTHGDRLVAILLTVAVQAQLWFGLGLAPDDVAELDGPLGRGAVALIGAACTASLAWRTRYPLLPLVLAIALVATLGGGGIDGLPSVVLTLVAVCWTVGSSTRGRPAAGGAVGVALVILVAIGRDPDAATSLGDLAVPLVVLGGAWLAGLATRLRRDQLVEAEGRALQAIAERDALAAAASIDRQAESRRSADADDAAATETRAPGPAGELDALTAREREVFDLVATGHSNREIADRLGIGEETVKTHVSHVLGKLDLHDRVQVAVMARRFGFVDRDPTGQAGRPRSA